MSGFVWIWSLASFFSARDGIPGQGVSSFLATCFYGLMFGAPTAILGGFILRRIMSLFDRGKWVIWTAVGAVLTPVLILAVGALGMVIVDRTSWSTAAMLTYGPLVLMKVWWLAIPAGAATAYVLSRVDRAFAP
ncbi:MAG TPA: hypothetical protein VEJ39_01100 [Candidatus Acidoferrales bacterium]|nr:hypothetical protein [Candidatus Acidoferrales bacterium]